MALASEITTVQAVVVGIVEGLTEFLPVSSTAHNTVVPQLLYGTDVGGATFDAVVQLGPMVAVLAYFWKDIAKYLAGMARTLTGRSKLADDVDARLGWYSILGTIPVLLLGKLLEKKIETSFRSITVIALSFIVFGIVLFLAERVGKREKPLTALSLKDALLVGLAQTLALIPGVSRSGATISASLFQGYDRESAARFSFLLSMPAITAAGLYKLKKDVLSSPNLHEMLMPYAVGTIVAGIVAFAVIHWFLGYVRKHNTGIFIVYRIIAGIALLLLVKTGILQNRPKETARVPTPIQVAHRPLR